MESKNKIFVVQAVAIIFQWKEVMKMCRYMFLFSRMIEWLKDVKKKKNFITNVQQNISKNHKKIEAKLEIACFACIELIFMNEKTSKLNKIFEKS